MRLISARVLLIIAALALCFTLVYAGTSTVSWFVSFGTLAPEWVSVGGQAYNPTNSTYLISSFVDVPLSFSIKCPGGDCGAITTTLSRNDSDLNIISKNVALCNSDLRGINASSQCLTTWTLHPTAAFPSSITFTATSCSSLQGVAGIACQTTPPITLTTNASAFCNSDCTSSMTPNNCVAACDGINGCSFFNTTVATELDGIAKNVTYISVDRTWSVVSCEGTPTPYYGNITAQIQCPRGETLLIFERIVIKDNKPVKLTVPICKKNEGT
ncbi:MAG TPA: hypothetical protein VK158_00055 [Acidobacteriota bacterium]|nr:hypothetical protein [Acidobacteriota bacterium]